MSTGSTDTLALVVAEIENPFFSHFARVFTDAAREAGFEVLVTSTGEELSIEESVVEVMLQKRVDGLVVVPASRNHRDHLTAAQAAGTHVVLVDRHIPGLAVDSVEVNNRAASEQAVSYLIGRGHRRIGLVVGASRYDLENGRGQMATARAERVNGYKRALRRAGIEPSDDYIRIGAFRHEAATAMVLDLLSLPNPPTAIFSTNAAITLSVVEALQSANVSIPDGISLLGFDDPDWAQVFRPKLTVVAQPIQQLGILAAQRVIARIRGDQTPPRRYRVATSLVIRDSVADRSSPGLTGSPAAHAG
jgi:LacI family transcriptional regulator